MKKVEFSGENFGHCRCPRCPVQHGNTCAEDKNNNYRQFDKAAANPFDGAKVYCSIGLTSCKGLKSKRPCLCPTCAVWYEKRLGKLHFCTKGSEEQRTKESA